MMLDRRRFTLAALAAATLAAGCAGPVGAYGPEEGVRRLMELSTRRAFARLARPGGFYDDRLTRIDPPEPGDGRAGDVLGAVLRTGAVRRRLAVALNEVAVDAADRASPVITDAIRRMSVADALAVARGGPTAATDLLRRETGGALVEAMLPDFAAGLESDLGEVLAAAVAARTGVDYRRTAREAAGLASASVFRAIAREEAAIRADPRATRDPAIIALLG